MTRRLVELALASHIPPSVWLDEGDDVIVTALDVLEQARKQEQQRR